ncbi:MAG: helix-turn-helix transcriptional regulator [Verrucomicrobiae bacterium]|nr:helix-turn-helix transcriptional regulator [Verrucomicrobiae bacterium]
MQAAPKEMIVLGRNIARMRVGKKLSQVKLAVLAEIHPRYLQKMENGTGNASFCVLLGLKRALGCQWKDFFRGLK